jgi:hypothetical protein
LHLARNLITFLIQLTQFTLSEQLTNPPSSSGSVKSVASHTKETKTPKQGDDKFELGRGIVHAQRATENKEDFVKGPSNQKKPRGRLPIPVMHEKNFNL